MPPDLTTLPALRTLAEERARDHHDAQVRAINPQPTRLLRGIPAGVARLYPKG